MRKGYSFTIVNDVLGQMTFERADDDWGHLIEAQGEKIWRKFAAKFDGAERNVKVKQALYQKGFPVEVINQYIEQKEQQHDGK